MTRTASQMENLHLFSVGSQMLMLEVWLDNNQSSSTSLHVKVVCYVDKDQAKEVGMATFAISEVLSSNHMPFNRWTHVVVSFSHKCEMTEVQIFLNTHPTKKLVIPLKSIALKLQQQAKQIQAEMCKQSITLGHMGTTGVMITNSMSQSSVSTY